MRVGRSHKVMLTGHVVKRSWLNYRFLNISCMQPIYSDIHTYHMYTILLDLQPAEQVVPSIKYNNVLTAMPSFDMTKNFPSTQNIRASKIHWLGCYIVD